MNRNHNETFHSAYLIGSTIFACSCGALVLEWEDEEFTWKMHARDGICSKCNKRAPHFLNLKGPRNRRRSLCWATLCSLWFCWYTPKLIREAEHSRWRNLRGAGKGNDSLSSLGGAIRSTWFDGVPPRRWLSGSPPVPPSVAGPRRWATRIPMVQREKGPGILLYVKWERDREWESPPLPNPHHECSAPLELWMAATCLHGSTPPHARRSTTRHLVQYRLRICSHHASPHAIYY